MKLNRHTLTVCLRAVNLKNLYQLQNYLGSAYSLQLTFCASILIAAASKGNPLPKQCTCCSKQAKRQGCL
ncbi:MAG TPA: hypothetical protein DCR21_04075 [Succinivibrionaceae bacterium]|nr:hypothetical protein [Succinivibrionaceae bacterium]